MGHNHPIFQTPHIKGNRSTAHRPVEAARQSDAIKHFGHPEKGGATTLAAHDPLAYNVPVLYPKAKNHGRIQPFKSRSINPGGNF